MVFDREKKIVMKIVNLVWRRRCVPVVCVCVWFSSVIIIRVT